MPKIVQLRIDIQGESVHRHEMRTAHSDRTNLTERTSVDGLILFMRHSVAEPYTRGSGDPAAMYVEIGDCVDDTLFEGMYILLQSHVQPLQVEHRVSYQLSGARVGNIAAPVDSVKFRSDSGEKGLID